MKGWENEPKRTPLNVKASKWSEEATDMQKPLSNDEMEEVKM